MKKNQPNINKPPESCPACNGQTEWLQISKEPYTAICYFCGHTFKSSKSKERK